MEHYHTGIAVGEAMTTKPISVSSDKTMMDAIKIMSQEKVGSLIVMGKAQFMGIVTDRDLVHKLANGIPLSERVSRFMTPKERVKTITADKDIYHAMEMMGEHGIRHLPVMENEKIIGLLTAKDILKIEPDLFDILAEKYEIREMERKPLGRE